MNKINSLIGENLDNFREKDNVKMLGYNVFSKLEVLFSSIDKNVKNEASIFSLTK